MKRVLIILLVGVALFTLSACETMKGVGKDVSGAGEWVQKKAE